MSSGLHHTAFACRDIEATNRFYSEVLGLTLVHTEVARLKDGYMKHLFYDLGDGNCMAFFYLQNAGEPEEFDTAISTGLGLPIWVNHVALRSTAEQVEEVRGRAAERGIKPTMELDHGWSDSFYLTDPNGILVELCVDTPGFVPDPEKALRILNEPVEN